MRGLKRREVVAICLSWGVVFLMLAAAALLALTIVVRRDGSLGELAPYLVILAGNLMIGAIIIRATLAALRLARTRALLARRPQAWLEIGPYRKVMLADEDLIRLAEKAGKLCEAESTTNPSLLRFLHEYGSFLEDYEPGVMRSREEARRLEGTVDWILERKRRGESALERRRRRHV